MFAGAQHYFDAERWRRIAIGAAAIFASWTAIAWLVVLHLHYLSSRPVNPLPYLYDYWSYAAVTPLIIYTAERSPFVAGRRLRSTLQHAAGALAFLFAQPAIATFVLPLLDYVSLRPMPRSAAVFRMAALNNFTMLIWVYVPVSVLTYYLVTREQERVRAVAEARLKAQLAEAQLQLLRSQLHPHFLFNSLHAVSALMGRDLKQARSILSCLGDLLRIAMDQRAENEAPLAAELEFASRYLQIEQARFGDRLRVELDVPPEARSALVPSLLLQPLVENAVKHGVERTSQTVTITILARRRNGWLCLLVRNNGPGLLPPGGAGGLGLANTRERLAQMYGDQQDLSLYQQEDGTVEVEVRIPFRFAPAAELPAEPVPLHRDVSAVPPHV